MNIVLTGFMGTGKTAVGRILAQKLGYSFLDMDEQIERDAGLPIRKIFRKRGEAAFREMEQRAVELVCLLDRFVIATGGGAVLRPANREALGRNGFLVNLSASVEEILRRLSPDHLRNRPLLAGRGRGAPEPEATRKAAEKLLAEREPAYARCDLRLDTTGRKPEEVAAEILRRLPDSPDGKKTADGGPAA